MNNDFELNLGDVRRKRRGAGGGSRQERIRGRNGRVSDGGRFDRLLDDGSARGSGEEDGDRFMFPFDVWRLIEAVRGRWLVLALATVGLGLGGFAFGYLRVKYAIEVQLIRRGSALPLMNRPEAGRGGEISFETLAALMKSDEVIQRVSTNGRAPMVARELGGMVEILPARNPELVTIALRWNGDAAAGTALADSYAGEVIRFTERLQTNEVEELNALLARKIAAIDRDMKEVNEELIAFSKTNQLIDVEKETEVYLTQLSSVDLRYETARIDLETVNLRLEALRNQFSKQSPGADRLQAARERLAALRLKLRDAHPDVQYQLRVIGSLEKEAALGEGTNVAPEVRITGNAVASNLANQITELETRKLGLAKEMEEFGKLRETVRSRMAGLSEKGVRYALIKSRSQALENLRSLLASRQRESQFLQESGGAAYKVFRPAGVTGTSLKNRWIKIGVLSFLAAMAGLVLSAAVVLVGEVVDNRLKTAADIQRVTKLPVLATLGNLEGMRAIDQVNWAFRALTILKGRLNSGPDGSLVCGFISANPGEGRSTWINLLVSAASQRGLRVLTIATRPSGSGPDYGAGDSGGGSKEWKAEVAQLPVTTMTTLSTNVLAYPAQVTEQLNNADSQPIIHIPLPGWVWNLERRRQWQAALNHWRRIDDLVLLIELPPASQPEAVLLAENVPQLIWLTSSGMAAAAETSEHLAILRHAGCRLVGAVLNREPESFWKTHVSRWIGHFAVWMAMSGLGVSGAEVGSSGGGELREPAIWAVDFDGIEVESGLELGGRNSGALTAVETNLSFTVRGPGKRAAWQERLTLGPGDVLDFSFYGAPELTRTNLAVGPDGRVSYLQAHDVLATGLTMDELRKVFDQELGRYYPLARTIIVPVAFQSKKFFVLGKVNKKGAFTLDRPLTIIEAVAQARGLETGLFERNSVELADLAHSFLIRNGKKVAIDFERLFLEGDLTQNIPVEPGDYLYFPSTSLNEIYVLGEVLSPGIAAYIPSSSLVAAISVRGGFTTRAYKSKVLVIRGSLTRPEHFAVNVADILAARNADFKLQPKDIVYVSSRPWIKLEELLDEAAQAFVQAAVATWAGVNIGPLITRPFAPKL